MVQTRTTWSFNSDGVSAAQTRETLPPIQNSMVVPAGSPISDPYAVEATLTTSELLVEALADLGVTHGFGLNGGGIAPFSQALERSSIQFMHFRHELGAAFAAIEASLAGNRLSLVMATTGPGLTNLYTGMIAARREGAKVVFVTGCTSAAQRGRGAFQETSHWTGDISNLFVSGQLFHHAAMLEDPSELPTALARLASGAIQPHGFVAHLGLPMSVQTARTQHRYQNRLSMSRPGACDSGTLKEVVAILETEPFVIWLGFGARHCAKEVQQLVNATGACVMCTPRAKGIFPEGSERFLGVTGLGGHDSVTARLLELKPSRALVVGTKLGEFSSFWAPELVPTNGFIHVDVDPTVFASAYPTVPTLGVQAEIGEFLRAIVQRLPSPNTNDSAGPSTPRSHAAIQSVGFVRPSYLMQMIQEIMVEQSDTIIMTEAGNSFALGSHYLRFAEPGRYRVSTGFGSMGHAAAGVIGAAMASGRKAIAIVGDGAMLMLNEISTAASYGTDAVWIVLNDARYGMIAQGMQSIGWQPFKTDFQRVDFVAVAHAMGGDGVRVEREAQLSSALNQALAARGPFVVDVLIDPAEMAPAARRNASLVQQGVPAELNSSRVGGSNAQ